MISSMRRLPSCRAALLPLCHCATVDFSFRESKMPSPSQPDIKPANAHLFGFWFLLLFSGEQRSNICAPPLVTQGVVGAYYVYFPQCVAILRRKIRDGMSIWLPLMCGVFFLLTTTVRTHIFILRVETDGKYWV